MMAWIDTYAMPFKDYVCDTTDYLSEAIEDNKSVLFEAQLGALRDIDYGIYPYTSGSSTIAAYAPIGAGIPEARRENVALEPSPEQVRMVAELGRRADAIRSGSVDPASDNMLVVTNDGRKLALDQRLVIPDLPDGDCRRPPRPRRRSGAYGGTANRRAASRSCSAT